MVGDRSERQGAPRHAGAQRVAVARRLVPGARSLDDRVSAQSRLAARAGVPGRAVVATTSARCEEDRRRRRASTGALFGGRARMFPNVSPLARRRARSPCGTHAGASDRGLALVLRRSPTPAEVKDFLRTTTSATPPVRAHRAGRHGELETTPTRRAGGTIARQYPYNYEMGLGRATRGFEGPRSKAVRTITDVDRGQRQRAPTSAASTTRAAPVHGGRQLGGPDGPVSAEAGALARLLLQREIEGLLLPARRSSWTTRDLRRV